MFEIGKKILCIESSESTMGSRIVEGKTYTLLALIDPKDVGLTNCNVCKSNVSLTIEETGPNCLWCSCEFRPIQPAHEINTAAIAKELVLTPERLDAPTQVPVPANEPQTQSA